MLSSRLPGGLEGVYYEYIAFPCGADRYSMPLGLVSGQQMFKVYRGAGLLSRLGKRGLIELLAPRDPLDYYLSVKHLLEHNLAWDEGCPRPDPARGLWLRCEYEMVDARPEYVEYKCVKLSRIAGEPPPYSRVYGCLVELLVLLTKARAGAGERWYLDYARGLAWCVSRASRGEGRYVEAADEIVRELEGILEGH